MCLFHILEYICKNLPLVSERVTETESEGQEMYPTSFKEAVFLIFKKAKKP